ncbi:MAG: hypothetical protein QXZ28_02890 [Candidatus Methanomethylicaceae archaeon]
MWYCARLRLTANRPLCRDMMARVHPEEEPQFHVAVTQIGTLILRRRLIPLECLECVRELYKDASLKTIKTIRSKLGIKTKRSSRRLNDLIHETGRLSSLGVEPNIV